LRVAVFGASGFIGSQVVREALAAGDSVTALVREPSRVAPSPNLSVVPGDVRDPAAVDEVIGGAQGVISAIGIRRGERLDAGFLDRAMRTILTSMERNGVRRIVAISGAAISLPGERKPFPHNAVSALVRVIAHSAVEAKQREYDVLSASPLEWTAVRPTRVVEGPASANPRIGTSASDLGMRVTRTDLARFMVSELKDRNFVHQAPFISS
jgi:putative NADH-flavin reductase